MTIQTRKELVEQFGDRLSGYIEEYIQDNKTRSGWLKTQILEMDVSDDFETSFNFYLERTDDLVQKTSLIPLKDEKFYCIRAESDLDDIYVDALDGRFIVLYSFMKSESFDKVISRLTDNSLIDQSWLPQEFMSSIDQLGLFKGYGGKFNNSFFIAEPNKQLDDNPLFRSLSFKSWGHTKRLLQLIQNDKELSNEFALTNMRIKKRFDPNIDDDAVIDDITYSGRITSLGKSFRAHHEVTQQILGAYRKLVVDVIEKNYSIYYEDNSVKGERVFFNLTKPIDDLDVFARKLFSGKQPFKLWGVNSVKNDEFTRYEVLDMHINEIFTADIYKDKLVLLLQKGVCGNTILRLVTLLQQNLGSGISLVDRDNTEIHLSIIPETA